MIAEVVLTIWFVHLLKKRFARMVNTNGRMMHPIKRDVAAMLTVEIVKLQQDAIHQSSSVRKQPLVEVDLLVLLEVLVLKVKHKPLKEVSNERSVSCKAELKTISEWRTNSLIITSIKYQNKL